MTSTLAGSTATSSYPSWLRAEAQRQNTYPGLGDSSLSEAHVQKLWQCIDAGASEDVGLNKLLVGLKQTNPSERAALMMFPRTQWSGTPHASPMTPLMGAVATGVLSTVRTLLDQGGTGVQLGVQVGTRTCNAMTVAAERGLVDIMSLLTDFGRLGSVDALGVVDQNTPNELTVAWLRSQGVLPGQFGGALENASERRDLAGLRVLLEVGGVDFARHRDLLPRVILEGDFKFAKDLVDLGAPLHMASLSLAQSGKRGKNDVAMMVSFAPLELVAFDGKKSNATAQNEMHITRPACKAWEREGAPKMSQSEAAAAGVQRRALISTMVSKGAPVTTDILKALVQQGDYAIYADIAHHRDFWPESVRDVETMLGLVKLNEHPFVHQMLTHQIEVMQGDIAAAKAAAKGKHKAGMTDDVAERRREIASENFDDAAALVMGGTSQIKLPTTTVFVAPSGANVAGRTQLTSSALVTYAKKAIGKDAGSTCIPAPGRKLKSEDKPGPSKAGGMFGLFKKNSDG